MMTPCDRVAERIALGEPVDGRGLSPAGSAAEGRRGSIDGEHADHVASCASCQRLVALPAQLGATKHAIDPGLGFSSRMTVGAQQRIASRRRRQLAAGAFTALAACGVFAFLVTRGPDRPEVAALQPGTQTDPKAHPEIDPDVASLVHLARAERVHVSARWGALEKPLKPYRKLLKGITP